MKKYIISMVIASISLAPTLCVFAQQDSSGIYKTAADFEQQKLSYAINYKTEKHKINDDILFHGSEIKVVHEGKTYRLDKKNTYGYKNTHGEVFRFVGKKGYKILNHAEAPLLYAYTTTSGGGKGGYRHTTVYFFSTDASSDAKSLTKENLKAAYPNSHKFHDALDANFKNDEDLAGYDSFHKKYKVIHLLQINGQ